MSILESGEVYSWGWNSYGQLGLGNNNNQSEPQLISSLNNKAIRISCGGYHTIILTGTTTLFKTMEQFFEIFTFFEKIFWEM